MLFVIAMVARSGSVQNDNVGIQNGDPKRRVERGNRVVLEKRNMEGVMVVVVARRLGSGSRGENEKPVCDVIGLLNENTDTKRLTYVSVGE